MLAVMHLVVGVWLSLSMLVAGAARLAAPVVDWFEEHPVLAAEPHDTGGAPHSGAPHDVVRPHGSDVIDVNRPRTPFDCELPIGEQWYGSRARCLAFLCAGQNVYNEYIFDAANRRRKNPCYGQSPTEFPGD